MFGIFTDMLGNAYRKIRCALLTRSMSPSSIGISFCLLVRESDLYHAKSIVSYHDWVDMNQTLRENKTIGPGIDQASFKRKDS